MHALTIIACVTVCTPIMLQHEQYGTSMAFSVYHYAVALPVVMDIGLCMY